MQDIAVQFEKHFWIHSVSLFPPQVHVGRSPIKISKPSSSFIYTNNFNDIQTYLLTQQIQQNNFLNNNDKSKYRNKTDENEKKSQIIRFR
ncbi:hypothetical protein [Spiroplasma endosymbiont of Apeira syringaria]|uniref:hypothetical protein n=1 Tax=Spiroplasma endosymbiont of Apeira syringaria TaxID=3066307 RepID=UPI0030D2FFBB